MFLDMPWRWWAAFAPAMTVFTVLQLIEKPWATSVLAAVAVSLPLAWVLRLTQRREDDDGDGKPGENS